MNMKWSDNGGGSFEQAPAGTHVARCIGLIDIGTQHGEYQGQATLRRQVIIKWELPNELMASGEYAGQPFTVSKFYTQSLHEKASLRHDLKTWRGRDFTEDELAGFEAKNIIGKPCMLSIVLNEKGRAAVSGVMALPKGTTVPDQFNPDLYFSLDDGEFDQAVYDGFSDKMKAMIDASDERAVRNNPQSKPVTQHADPSNGADFADDDIPFAPLGRRRYF
jgi:hypothetical protein